MASSVLPDQEGQGEELDQDGDDNRRRFNIYTCDADGLISRVIAVDVNVGKVVDGEPKECNGPADEMEVKENDDGREYERECRDEDC